jgi:hypothetical protein
VVVRCQIEVMRKLSLAVRTALGLELDEEEPIRPQDRVIRPARSLTFVTRRELELVDEGRFGCPRAVEAPGVQLAEEGSATGRRSSRDVPDRSRLASNQRCDRAAAWSARMVLPVPAAPRTSTCGCRRKW